MRREDDTRKMRIVIGSGKGGTGKTTVAVSLALSLSRDSVPVQLVDCDVEEPNVHIFLNPEIDVCDSVSVDVPIVDGERCTRCGACAEFCQFNALAVLPSKVLTFHELCHSCGGCARVCPADAIHYEERRIGKIEIGRFQEIQFASGYLNVGEARCTPVIAELKRHINPTRDCIIDAPPGTSCPFVEAVRGCDVCLLVAEPTPFGLNDLALAVEVTDYLHIPRAVVINRADIGDDRVERYCMEKDVDVLLSIPHHIEIAQAYAVGTPMVDAMPQYGDELRAMFNKLKDVGGGRR